MQAALTEGVSALIEIERRLTSDSGNANYAGYKADASSNAYVDFLSRKGSMETAAQVMAGDIKMAIATGQLSAGEISRLQGVLAGLTGDANLAETYVGQMVAAPAGSTPPGGNPGNGGLLADGFVPAGDGRVPMDDGTNVPLNDSNIVPNMDENGESGYNEGQGTKPVKKSARPVSKRQQYMGRTPGKTSQTGIAVITRMESEGKIINSANGIQFQASNEAWYPINEADMAHIVDAVSWWNEAGRKYGPKSKEVLEFMRNPNNYYLEHYSINRSEGAKLRETYLPPLKEKDVWN